MKKSQITKTLLALLLALLLTLAPATVFAAPAQALTVDQLLQNQADSITRGQFAMLLNACLELPEMTGGGFKDVPANHPYAADISTAQAIGYMNGDGGGIFRPDDIITGAEAAICVNYFLGFDLTKVQLNNLTTVPAWAKAAVSNLLDLQMVTLELTDKKALTVADAIDFATALLIAVMFPGSPYALMQANEKDDFYAYNNRQYLATATAEPGYPFAMSFIDPEFVVADQTAVLLAGILANPGEPGSDGWKISELHKMYMDEQGRAESLSTLMPIIEEIKAISSIAELNALASKYATFADIHSFYSLSARRDPGADATKWCAIVLPASFMLGSRDYYADTGELAPLHDALKQYIASVLAYAGETDDLESRASAVFDMEQGNALVSMPLEILSAPDVLYTKSSWGELDKLTAGSNALNYFPEMREALKDAAVYCPDVAYIEHIEAQYIEDNLDVLKDFAIFSVLNDFGSFIGDDFGDLYSDVQTILLGGAPEKMSLEARAQNLVKNLMSNAFSKLYADEYASPAIKADVTQIVELIRDKYRERIAGLDWMSAETKQMAIEKLDAIKVYVAYPDSYETRFAFDVKAKADGGNLVDFYIDFSESIYAQYIDSLNKPYAINLWNSVPTYTVNAYYLSLENAIMIPAGILQEPFYSKDAAREANLGAIGAVIAHEISHAFDNSGAMYDKTGALADWWAEDDYAAFSELTDGVAAALSKIVFVGGQSVNGALCTGETIADLGAIACVLDIADDDDGSDLAAVMRSWAGIWAARMSPEVAAFMLAMDNHAPNKVRVNFTLAQFDAFYEVFGITETDGMYIAPENRITIW